MIENGFGIEKGDARWKNKRTIRQRATMADWETDDWGYVNGVNEDTLKEINGIFGRGSDFVGRISEIRRTSPRKNRTRARVTWISRSESSARCRIYARKNRIWGAVFRGLCS